MFNISLVNIHRASDYHVLYFTIVIIDRTAGVFIPLNNHWCVENDQTCLNKHHSVD